MKTKLAVVAPKKSTRALIIDEYGELDRQVQQFKPTADRHEELKKLIKGWYDEHPAGEPAIARGTQYEIQVSERQNESYVADIQAVYKALGGLPKFLQFVKRLITKSALAEALKSESRAEAFFDKARIGSRRLKAVLRSAPEMQDAA